MNMTVYIFLTYIFFFNFEIDLLLSLLAGTLSNIWRTVSIFHIEGMKMSVELN